MGDATTEAALRARDPRGEFVEITTLGSSRQEVLYLWPVDCAAFATALDFGPIEWNWPR